mmetsp:Transcript_28981/g.66310  ORF Transcript_28981/g.66310 Transcript_28981/m.66310 type:complete len:1236 (-) Transcript_28981:478-4185(-)
MGTYVQVRRDFDKLESLLSNRSSDGSHAWGSSSHLAGRVMKMDKRSLKWIVMTLWETLRRPRRMQRYRKLLVQVRYHSLREQFVQKNQCKGSFPLYIYLKRVQRDVFENLVHISSSSWMMLMFLTVILNYVLAIVVSETSIKEVHIVLMVLFFALCLLVVFVVMYTQHHMNWIFFQIMHYTLKDDGAGPIVEDSSLVQNNTPNVVSKQKQIDLFWNSNPERVMDILRCLQFICSFQLAFLLTLWFHLDDLSHTLFFRYGEQLEVIMVIVAMVVTIIFIYVQARVINQFTLCTSVGQLVNEKLLNEVKIEDLIKTERKRREEEVRVKHNVLVNRKMKGKNDEDKNDSAKNAAHWEAINKLVTSSTKELPTDLEQLSSINRIPRTRSRRQKSRSEGVAAMASGFFADVPGRAGNFALSSQQTAAPLSVRDDTSLTLSKKVLAPELTVPDRENTRTRRRRLRSKSDGIVQMRQTFLSDMENRTQNRKAPSSEPKTQQVQRTRQNTLEPFLEDIPAPSHSGMMGRPHHCLGSDYVQTQQGQRTRQNALEPFLEDILAPSHSGMMGSPLHCLGKDYLPTKAEADTTSMGISSTEDASSSVCTEDESISVAPEPITSLVPYHDNDPVVGNICKVITMEKIRHIFLSDKYHIYRLVSAVLFILFMGWRLNVLVVTSKTVLLGGDPWKACHLEILFWMMIMMCVIFIIEGMAMSATFFCERQANYWAVVTGCIDVVMGGANICILLLADHRRRETSAVCGCISAGLGNNVGLVGIIEPWLILILWRVVPSFGWHHREQYHDRKKNKGLNGNSVNDASYSLDNDSGTIKQKENNSFNGHNEHPPGAVSVDVAKSFQLWQETIQLHPEEASKYGIYSRQILLLMLGFKLDDVDNMDDGHGRLSIISISSKPLLPVDNKAIVNNNHTNDTSTSTIASPSSPLAVCKATSTLMKNMRRIQIKLPAPLDRWKIVDAVITRNVLILMKTEESAEGAHGSVEDIVVKSRGGQGLPLSDVTAGRIIIGQVDLSEVEAIRVERHLYSSSSRRLRQVPDSQKVSSKERDWLPALKGRGIEYWIPNSDAATPHMMAQREIITTEEIAAAGWEDINYDILRLDMELGNTILIRFVNDWYTKTFKQKAESDLENATDSGPGPTRALKWCQSIVRSYPKLQKGFEHFGGSEGEEMDDYLEYHRAHKKKSWTSSTFFTTFQNDDKTINNVCTSNNDIDKGENEGKIQIKTVSFEQDDT